MGKGELVSSRLPGTRTHGGESLRKGSIMFPLMLVMVIALVATICGMAEEGDEDDV